jgi:hypothetical protein
MSVAGRAIAVVTFRPSIPATNQNALAMWNRTTHSLTTADAHTS